MTTLHAPTRSVASAGPRASRRPTASARRDLRWFLLTAISVALFAAVPLIFNLRFYFQDDSENGAFGVWHHIGESLLQGKLPVLNPSVWSSGNYLAEGQWGTWNPLIMLIGVLAYLSSNAVIFMTVLKALFLMVAGTGVFVLARSYGARAPLAYVAGLAVTLNGFTMYFDAPSWVTGLLVWALVPYFWVLLRRLVGRVGQMHRGSTRVFTPLWPFLIGYLIVTVGYVQGVFAIGFVLLAVGIDALARKHWRGAWCVVGAGVALVLVAITVFLPGALTGSVTNRAVSIVGNDGYMSIDLGGLFSSTIAAGYPQVASWWWTGPTATSPVAYVAWFLPLLVFVDWQRALSSPRRAELRDVFIVFFLSLGYVLLPTILGPLRYPVRFMPYVALTAIIITVVLLSRSRVAKPSGQRMFAAAILISIAVYISWAQLPPHYLVLLVSGIGAIGGIGLVWLLLRRHDADPSSFTSQQLWPTIAVAMTAVTLALTFVQHYDTHASPLFKANVPADTNLPANVLAGVEGDTIVIGDPLVYGSDPAAWNETLMANMWYLSPAAVQNRYQLIGFAAYNGTLCLEYLGGTCPELLPALFEKRSATDMLLVDQLSIDNIQILKADVPAELWATVPTGWSELRDTGLTVVWSRDKPVGPAGDVVWSTDGTEVTTLSQSDTAVSVRIDAVPANGGQIALSRLAWPGYTASNASISATPVDQFLLGVDVDQAAVGEIVEITFRPPGWTLEVASWLIAVGGILVWSALSLVLTHRHRNRTRSASMR